MAAIKGLIFDFDGLIIDSESPEYQSWADMYKAHNCSLPFEKWAECIGTADAFDPAKYLEELIGRPIDRAEALVRRRAQFAELMATQPLLPGVADCIASARRRGIKLGVASSSTRNWVVGNLSRFGLATEFDAICCREDVVAVKPDPALYVAVLQGLGIRAKEAIALEDSPNGVLAAKRAGIFCVAVPNAITSRLCLDHADCRLSSLAQLSFDELLDRPGTGEMKDGSHGRCEDAI
jgi:HAD superfamily hydrolase (TIGR01509 family)